MNTQVQVNGVVMVRDSEIVKCVYPGQALRYPIEGEGRWAPLAKASYLDNLLASEIPHNVVDYSIDPELRRGESEGDE